MIREGALQLPVEQRAELIDVLWESLSPEDMKNREQAWAMEAERCIEAYGEGKLKARDFDAALSDLRKSLRK